MATIHPTLRLRAANYRLIWGNRKNALRRTVAQSSRRSKALAKEKLFA